MKETWRHLAYVSEGRYITFTHGLAVGFGEIGNVSKVYDLGNLVYEFQYIK